MTAPASYDEACRDHRWEVPDRYNIAHDVCDKHPRDKPAMVWEDWQGNRRDVDWGEIQDLSNRIANVLVANGVRRGDRVAMLLTATPETAAAFFATWKVGAILLSMSVLYGDEGIRHRVTDSQARVLVTDREHLDQVEAGLAETVLVLDAELIAQGSPEFTPVDTAADDPAQLYYSSGTTGLAKGILHAHRYLLAHEEFVYCHDVRDGELFHGMGEWAWAAGISPLLGPWRLGAVQMVFKRQGGFDPAQQLEVLSRHGVTNVFTTPTAMRSMMAIEDAGDALSAAVPPCLLGRRAAQPGGDPLVPRAVRGHRPGLLRADRVLSARGQLPLHGGPRGLHGQAGAGVGGGDPRRGREARPPGRAWRDLPAGTLEPALPARVLEQPRGVGADVRRRVVPHARRRAARTPTATTGTRAAPTT